MNSIYTVDDLHKDRKYDSEAIRFSHENYSQQFAEAFHLQHIAAVTGLAISLFAASPVTAIDDPWLIERQQRDAVITIPVYQELIGRSITRNEALRIAGKILARAEQERLDFAEYEAARGIQWETSP